MGIPHFQVGINQTCGVDGCYCDVLSDLLCVEPPLPKQICVKALFCAAGNVWGDPGDLSPDPVHLVLVGYMGPHIYVGYMRGPVSKLFGRFWKLTNVDQR